MLVIVITAFITLLISGARDVTCSTAAKGPSKIDYDNQMLKELLQRMDKIEGYIKNMKADTNVIRADLKDVKANMEDMKADLKDVKADMKDMKADNKNQSVVMETIVEQQMVITAEIFTVSQTLPFCCCHYQNTTDQPEIETTTPKPVKSFPTNCAEAMGESGSDGIYQINVTNSDISTFDVYCMKYVAKSIDEEMINGTWLIIQRRQDGSTNFRQNWIMYKHGFGDLKRNFWIGLGKLHALTKSNEQELWVQLENYDGKTAWAKYSHFAIADEYEYYALKPLERYDGTAGDALRRNEGFYWMTFDNNHDKLEETCAAGWWYSDGCGYGIHGVYGSNKAYRGVNWHTFGGVEKSLKYTHMAIRPRTS